MEVSNALTEHGDRGTQHLHAGTIFPAGTGRQLVDVVVKQGLVVVVFHVVDHLGRLAHIACRLAAVVNVLQGFVRTLVSGKAVIAEGSCQADPHHVCGAQQVLRRCGGLGVGRVRHAVDVALVFHHVIAAVARAAAAHCITPPVTEGADARTVQ
jgi:hypothetical protein